eukprot:6190755-Pleurochrysis_carterae.AAC.2
MTIPQNKIETMPAPKRQIARTRVTNGELLANEASLSDEDCRCAQNEKRRAGGERKPFVMGRDMKRQKTMTA